MKLETLKHKPALTPKVDANAVGFYNDYNERLKTSLEFLDEKL